MQLEFLEADPKFGEECFQWRQDPAARHYNPIDELSSKDTTARLNEQRANLKNLKEGKTHRWFIKDQELLIGTVSLDQYNPRMKSASIGYHINTNHAGKGYGSAIVSSFIANILEIQI